MLTVAVAVYVTLPDVTVAVKLAVPDEVNATDAVPVPVAPGVTVPLVADPVILPAGVVGAVLR